MKGDMGEGKDGKIGGRERGQRERRAQSYKRAPPAPPPSPSAILGAFEVDRRPPVFTPEFRLQPTDLRHSGYDTQVC